MRKAKLFIKGLREPIDLTEEQGIKAQQVKNGEGPYANLSDRQTISIGDGKWTGERSDIRYIIFEKADNPSATTRHVYTKEDLLEFGDEIESYFLTKQDDEFDELVEKYTELALSSTEKIMASPFTRERLLTIRKNFDGDVANKRELVRAEVVKLIEDRRCGRMTKKGETLFLQKMNAITVDENGNFLAIRNPIIYGELTEKLAQYSDYRSRKEYASDKQLEGYDEMMAEVVDSMEM